MPTAQEPTTDVQGRYTDPAIEAHKSAVFYGGYNFMSDLEEEKHKIKPTHPAVTFWRASAVLCEMARAMAHAAAITTDETFRRFLCAAYLRVEDLANTFDLCSSYAQDGPDTLRGEMPELLEDASAERAA